MSLPLTTYDPDEDRKKVEKNKENRQSCQKIIMVYKMSIGAEKYGKEWNSHYFPILMPTAHKLLKLFKGDWKSACDCVQDIAEKIKDWNPEAEISLYRIFEKHAFKWRMDRLEKEAKSPEIKIL